MTRRCADWINENEFTNISLLHVDSGRLLGPYMSLSKIIRYCPNVQNIHLICSDSWYSQAILGQYWFLKSEKKIHLPLHSRIYAVQPNGYKGPGVIHNADMYGYKIELDYETFSCDR
eukprot:UN01803